MEFLKTKSLKPKNESRDIPILKDPVINYPIPPLEQLLEQPAGYKYFAQLLESERALENLECYSTIGNYKKNPTQEAAKFIWNEFIQRRSQKNVNLTAQVYTPIEQHMTSASQKVNPKLFDDAQTALLSLMNINHFVLFRYVVFRLAFFSILTSM